MKNCKVCLEEKELYLFDKTSKSGYRNTCRKCRNIKNTSNWLSKEGNVEKRRDYMNNYMFKKNNESDLYKKYTSILRKIRLKIKNDIDFRKLFENKFDENMNWENYKSYWEIDHIISAIKMIKNGYTDDEINDIRNIRPLKVTENRSRCKKESNEYCDYKECDSKKRYRIKYYKSNKNLKN